ncbi:MAG: hypothetical protein WCO14_01865, partial [bacterium]
WDQGTQSAIGLKPAPTKTGLATVGIAALDASKPVAPVKTPIVQPSPGLRQYDSLRQHLLLG